jgi:hypothetical protein
MNILLAPNVPCSYFYISRKRLAQLGCPDKNAHRVASITKLADEMAS